MYWWNPAVVLIGRVLVAVVAVMSKPHRCPVSPPVRSFVQWLMTIASTLLSPGNDPGPVPNPLANWS